MLQCTHPASICVSLMIKIKICILPQKAYWDGNFGLDTAISVIPSVLFSRLLLENINLSHTVMFPLDDVPNVKSVSMQNSKYNALHGKKTNIDVAHKGYLHGNHLRPIYGVSVDNFESRLKGRTCTSFGSSNSEQFVGGCVFVDHMSGYIHVEYQLGFLSSETIRAKQKYEKMFLDRGILVNTYLAYNGVFKTNRFFLTHS